MDNSREQRRIDNEFVDQLLAKSNDHQGKTTFIDLDGYAVDEDSDQVAAKLVEFSKETRYYIKSGNGYLYHPESVKGFSHYKLRNVVSLWKFVEVTESGFFHYLKFLETKNERFYKEAERSVK